MIDSAFAPSDSLKNVRYEIRGRLARRAQELQRQGYEIISLNIGNPGLFDFRTPETMRLAMIGNLPEAEAYCHQKGIFPAREAVVMQQQARGVTGVSAEEVFIGNGVSELIDLVLRALVVINPNNPTGAVYPRATLEALAGIAERHRLVVFSDEIYDQMVYAGAEFVAMATLVHDTLCATLSGLSKVYRACGYRVGWAAWRPAGGYLSRAARSSTAWPPAVTCSWRRRWAPCTPSSVFIAPRCRSSTTSNSRSNCSSAGTCWSRPA